MNPIRQYRKKPVVITAWQTDIDLYIKTLEGEMHASPGDWIITGVNGEQYPCKPDIFEKTYEPADLEPMPDARGLADLIAESEEELDNRGGHWGFRPKNVGEVVRLIAAHDARLLNEAAERIRAEKVDAEATGDEGDIAYNCAIDDAVRALYESAAIKGAAHE